MASFLGAFPFPSHAPAILTNDALLKVVTILADRHRAVIKRGRDDWIRELYRSLAVHDRGAVPAVQEEERGSGHAEKDEEAERGVGSAAKGFAIDQVVDEEGEDEEDDQLVLAALESMDAIDVYRHGEQRDVHHSMIPSDNFLRLVQLLLVTAPLKPQESVSMYSARLDDEQLVGLRSTARSVLASFAVDQNPGITFKCFKKVISSTLPYLFDSLNPLFEHFLFAKDFDLSKRQHPTSPLSAERPPVAAPEKRISLIGEPILQKPGEILDFNVLSQLSFFLRGSTLFGQLRPLYDGSTAGFSMGSFEKNVFKWQAPSLLLVSGSLLPDTPNSSRERAFAESLPAKRLPSSSHETESFSSPRLIFGAYVPGPWKQTHKSCFGDAATLLFQLSPTHDIFTASALSNDYAYFSKAPTAPGGIGFGSPMSAHTPSSSVHRTSGVAAPHLALGPVSLHLDDGLEFGVFTHLGSGGGSFAPSKLPHRQGKDWQDRFEIEALEVWGCGGDEEAEAQRKAWAWEEREAENRRKINLGTGDIEADRELLRMAGLVGAGQSGGSMA